MARVAKAKGYLERAMKLDPHNVDAVYTMATILGQQQQYEAAVKLYDMLKFYSHFCTMISFLKPTVMNGSVITDCLYVMIHKCTHLF